MSNEVRIDKWLWASRIFKTRSIAANACKNGRITLGNAKLKPARTVKEGDIINVKKSPITYSFKILKAISNRVGAKLVPDVRQDVTSQDQREHLEMIRIEGNKNRAKGTGRPTKKERRDIDEFFESADDSILDFDD